MRNKATYSYNCNSHGGAGVCVCLELKVGMNNNKKNAIEVENGRQIVHGPYNINYLS